MESKRFEYQVALVTRAFCAGVESLIEFFRCRYWGLFCVLRTSVGIRKHYRKGNPALLYLPLFRIRMRL
jgi:hypothetical protein